MPSVRPAFSTLSLALAVAVAVCLCPRACAQAAADPAWKVPVATFAEAFEKAKYYFERPEHDAAEFYLRECLRYGIPKRNHDVTDAQCNCMLAVVRAQQGYGFEATTTIMDVCDRYKDNVDCLDIAADAAHKASEARDRKIQGPDSMGATPPWMAKTVSNSDEAIRLALAHQGGAAGEYCFRQCFAYGTLSASDDYFCRLQLCHGLSGQDLPEKACEAYAIARQTYRLYNEPKALLFVVQALISYGDFGGAKRYLAEIDHRYTPKVDAGTIEAFVDYLNRTRLATRIIIYTCDVPHGKWGDATICGHIGGRPAMFFPLLQDRPGIRVTNSSLAGAASYKERVLPALGTKFLEVMLIPGNDLHFSATVEETPSSSFDPRGGYREAPVPADIAGSFLGSYTSFGGDVVVDPNGPLAQRLVPLLKGPDRLDSAINVYAWCQRNLNKDPSVVLARVPSSSEGGLKYLTTLQCEHRAWVEVALLRACGVPADTLRGVGAIDGKLYQHTMSRPYINDWTLPHGGYPVVSELNFLCRCRYTGTAYAQTLPGTLDEKTGIVAERGTNPLDPIFCEGQYKVLSSRIEDPEAGDK